jgi:hypothetical protein
MTTKGISNGPTQTDRGRPIRSDFDWGREKSSPWARRILVAVSAVTQTRPKFGRSLRRRGLTAQSACVLPFTPGGPSASDRGRFVCCAPRRFRGLHREKGCTAASQSPPPSMALHHWATLLPILCRHQWRYRDRVLFLFKRRCRGRVQ